MAFQRQIALDFLSSLRRLVVAEAGGMRIIHREVKGLSKHSRVVVLKLKFLLETQGSIWKNI